MLEGFINEDTIAHAGKGGRVGGTAAGFIALVLQSTRLSMIRCCDVRQWPRRAHHQQKHAVWAYTIVSCWNSKSSNHDACGSSTRNALCGWLLPMRFCGFGSNRGGGGGGVCVEVFYSVPIRLVFTIAQKFIVCLRSFKRIINTYVIVE